MYSMLWSDTQLRLSSKERTQEFLKSVMSKHIKRIISSPKTFVYWFRNYIENWNQIQKYGLINTIQNGNRGYFLRSFVLVEMHTAEAQRNHQHKTPSQGQFCWLDQGQFVFITVHLDFFLSRRPRVTKTFAFWLEWQQSFLWRTTEASKDIGVKAPHSPRQDLRM